MGFSKKKYKIFFKKSTKVANLSLNATAKIKCLETLKIWVMFKKQIGFRKKSRIFQKLLKVPNLS